MRFICCSCKNLSRECAAAVAVLATIPTLAAVLETLSKRERKKKSAEQEELKWNLNRWIDYMKKKPHEDSYFIHHDELCMIDSASLHTSQKKKKRERNEIEKKTFIIIFHEQTYKWTEFMLPLVRHLVSLAQ